MRAGWMDWFMMLWNAAWDIWVAPLRDDKLIVKVVFGMSYWNVSPRSDDELDVLIGVNSGWSWDLWKRGQHT